MLAVVRTEDVGARRVDASARPEVVETVRTIIDDVRREGGAAVRRHAERFDERSPGEPLVLDRSACDAALAALEARARDVLERSAARIRAFAEAQLACVRPMEMRVEGFIVGHTIEPIERAACYAPGGRYPLPSSVLMTAIPARVAGVRDVTVVSPKPTRETRAAAAIAGADRVLAVGGAQAIAAAAFGADDEHVALGPVDVIVGPGNAYVTEAKRQVSGRVRIDGLNGPSELLVVADASADAGLVAADLLAQAEHDVDARALLIAIDADGRTAFVDAVNDALRVQLATLPTAAVAERALASSWACVARSREEAARLANRVAAEHLQLHVADAEEFAPSVRHAGAVFVGAGAAEVLGDYGVGPNHTLPTGGAARFQAGLSVLDFLRLRTFVAGGGGDSGGDRGGASAALATDAAALARMEGLEAHARAAERRAGAGLGGGVGARA